MENSAGPDFHSFAETLSHGYVIIMSIVPISIFMYYNKNKTNWQSSKQVDRVDT